MNTFEFKKIFSSDVRFYEIYNASEGFFAIQDRNDSNELLAVAKLSRPLRKDFTKEALVRVKLDF